MHSITEKNRVIDWPSLGQFMKYKIRCKSTKSTITFTFKMGRFIYFCFHHKNIVEFLTVVLADDVEKLKFSIETRTKIGVQS